MPEDQRERILAQPSAMKEVYAPADHYVNGHVILRGADGWHLFYHPMEPHPPSNRMLHATCPCARRRRGPCTPVLHPPATQTSSVRV